MAKIAYLSGPISKDPNYKENFAQAENILIRYGYKVNNPCSLNCGTLENEWSDAMKKALIMMLESDIVFMLDGYEASTGASIEYNLAFAIDMPVEHIKDYI